MAAGVTTGSTGPWGKTAIMCPISGSSSSWNTVGCFHVECKPRVARALEFFNSSRKFEFLYEITPFCNHSD